MVRLSCWRRRGPRARRLGVRTTGPGAGSPGVVDELLMSRPCGGCCPEAPRGTRMRPPRTVFRGRPLLSAGGLPADPLLVDLVVRAVFLGLLQLVVDHLQQRLVAGLDGHAVLLAGVELGGDLELAGVVLDVLGPYRKVVDDRLDLTAFERLLLGAEVLVRDDLEVEALLLDLLLDVDLSGGAGLHADLLAVQIFQRLVRLVRLDQQCLVGVEVALREVHHLLPLGRDGHRGGCQVALAGLEVLAALDALERGVDVLLLDAELLGDQRREVHVEADHVLALLGFEGCVRQAGADRQLVLLDQTHVVFLAGTARLLLGAAGRDHDDTERQPDDRQCARVPCNGAHVCLRVSAPPIPFQALRPILRSRCYRTMRMPLFRDLDRVVNPPAGTPALTARTRSTCWYRSAARGATGGCRGGGRRCWRSRPAPPGPSSPTRSSRRECPG